MFNYLFKKSHVDLEISQNFIPDSVGIFLINLDRAKDRLEFVKKNIEQLEFPFHRISAIDGNLLSDSEIEKIADKNRYKKYFKMFPEKGTIGCTLSHEKVYREFLKSNYEFALIFEDDVVFNPDELKNCVKNAIQKKNLWDILSFEILHDGWPMKIANLYEEKFLSVYLSNVKHSGCYLINRETAKKLIEKIFPIFMGLDHYFTASWEFDIKFLGVEPRIVHQNFGNSQIKISAPKKFYDLQTKISNAIYNVKRSIIHFIYNLYLYFKIKE